MKKAISAILACVLLMSVFTMLFIFNAQAESSSTTTYFVNKGDNWEYICTEIGADEDYVAAPDGWLDNRTARIRSVYRSETKTAE